MLGISVGGNVVLLPPLEHGCRRLLAAGATGRCHELGQGSIYIESQAQTACACVALGIVGGAQISRSGPEASRVDWQRASIVLGTPSEQAYVNVRMLL